MTSSILGRVMIAFEGDVHELRGSRDPYLQSFLS